MNINMFPTKGNLIAAKNSLALARQGYDLMDKKRNILVREMMDLVDQASTIQTEIDTTFRAAYEALQQANIEMGIHMVQDIAKTVPVENTVKIKTRSIMVLKFRLWSMIKRPAKERRIMRSTAPESAWMRRKRHSIVLKS